MLRAPVCSDIGKVISWAIAVEQIMAIPVPQILGKVEMFSGAARGTDLGEIVSAILPVPVGNAPGLNLEQLCISCATDN